MSKSKSILTVAIDFGTTYSGYAYAFAGNSEIFTNTNWSSDSGLASYKAPTCVLTRYTPSTKIHEFLEFGFKAQDAYVNDGQNENICLFDKFKMKLHNIEGKATRHGMKIWDKRGTVSANATTIFAMALNYLKEHIMKHFVETGKRIDTEYITWVLTVPAIWNESAKAFMRRAALQAGLISTEDSDNLFIVLEPEAASLYCRKLNMKHFVGEGRSNQLTMSTGTVYMLVDAGGGTVDITVHEVMESGNVKEVVAASGGAAGGTNVDAEFKQLLTKLWKDEFIKCLQAENSRQWLNIEHSFERAKRNASPSAKTNFNLFSLTLSMNKKYQEATGGDIWDSFENNEHLGIIFNDSDSTIAIKSDRMNQVFKPTIDRILKCVDDVMKQIYGIKYIFMVGGLSSSQYLSNAIKEAFGYKAIVFIPEDPALAVLKGAVEFGFTPDFVRSRIARKTYGAGCTLPFDESIHKPENKIMAESGARCDKLFCMYIQKNTSVELGSSVIEQYSPLYGDQEDMTIPIYSSDSDNPMYTDDEGTKKIGSLTVQSPDTSRGKDRKFALAFYFGETEIKATLKEKNVLGAVEKTTRITFIAN